MQKIKRNTPRVVKFTPGINPYALGSTLAEFGNTKIHITATVEESVPPFLRNSGQGWVTAEYSMLPGSTHTRIRRDRKGIGGRAHEIQRLIGRSLRGVVDLEKLGERTITVDCDVLVADGGTRTASISGGFVALKLAIQKLLNEGLIQEDPIIQQIGAISVGINSAGEIIADLNYEEDSSCETDMNIVMTKSGEFIEVQGTAEGRAFSRGEMDGLLTCATESLKVVFEEQDRLFQ